MKKSSFCLGLIGLVALSFISPQKAMALDAQYLRNGECYLLIGEGNANLKGVYRLNNPEKNVSWGNNPKQVISGTQINNTLGFNVDLERKIYTFTETKDANWSKSTEPLYRQVIDDGVTARVADYGQHAWIHYDHRSWKTRADGTSCANVYRTGPAGRNIKGNSTSNWSGFKSAGPGDPATKPAGYTLPVMSGSAQCNEFSGKNWYKIPNESWYSSWRQGNASGNSISKFYFVFGDRVEVKYHNFNLYTWTPDNLNKDAPNYDNVIGNAVAQTKEEKVSRNVYAGCLDGCGGASGSGSAEAASKLNDIAFQPPMKDHSARTYFYQRTAGATDYEIKLNNSSYSPSSGNPLIGMPASTDTYWLCISLRNSATDFIYCLGTAVIKDWYNQTGLTAPSNMNITAVTVSNQWSQDGGIVYAYDKANKTIYKFERKESEGAPITSKGFLALDLEGNEGILKKIGANSGSELDDIKADGFGSLYFALSHPAKSVSDYDPRNYFKDHRNECIHVHEVSHDTSKGETQFRMLYRQDYGKKVYQRDYVTGDITFVGGKNYATRYYNVTAKIKDAGWNVIKGLSLPDEGGRIITELASWTATVGGYAYKSTWPATYFQTGLGGCNHYSELNYTDPGNCKLAVINVPTPPKVHELGPEHAYLDIIGPYSDYPAYDSVNRVTNQFDNLLTDKSNLKTDLDADTVYFYMVENYPLTDGAQDPTADPTVNPTNKPPYLPYEFYDNDGRRGGFTSAIKDPTPYSTEGHSDGIQYEWKTWMVMDPYYNCVCKEIQYVPPEKGREFNTIFSPIGGKYIIACRVKYHWYNYDNLTFGSTKDDLDSVLTRNVYAAPAAKNSQINATPTVELGSDRLNYIKDTFKFTGKLKNKEGKEVEITNRAFMKEPFNQYGESISIDYSQIVAGDQSDYWAFEPVSIKPNASEPPPLPIVFDITRCDDIPDVATSTYIPLKAFWSKAPAGDKTFGIVSDEKYNWQIDKVAQEYMFKDISKNNSISPADDDYNYVAHMMLTATSSFYANGRPSYQFINNLGDLEWADNKIFVTAKLIYNTPDGEVSKYLTNGLENSSTSSSNGNDVEVEYEVKSENSLWEKNTPVYYTTSGDLPPTDPKDARIQISMRREYKYKKWVYINGKASFPVDGIPGWFKITGEAKIRIMDIKKPQFAWRETVPNNLFGITGQQLQSNVGPDGKKNPQFISFTLTDNNPWEAIENEVGLSLNNHIKNYAYNFGSDQCKTYCASNSTLLSKYNSLGSSLAGLTGIKNDIANKKRQALDHYQKTKCKELPIDYKTSSYNYKSLFSRYARDVRLGFQTAKRLSKSDSMLNNRTVGSVIVDKADVLYTSFTSRKFDDNNSKYTVHYHDGSKYQSALVLNSQSHSRSVGGTTVYDATLNYHLPLTSIDIGTNGTTTNNYIPDGYANNTPGYMSEDRRKISPYKFYVSAVDSSGNYTGEKELNLVLNVKDDIPPIGYGSMEEMKNKSSCYFPYQSFMASGNNKDENKTPIYSISGENYFGTSIDSSLIRATVWTPMLVEDDPLDKGGYINGVKSNVSYQAMKWFDQDIKTKADEDSVYKNQVNKFNPFAVEDNIPCMFDVFVHDNCGMATATLNIKYYTVNTQGNQVDVSESISSGWAMNNPFTTDGKNYYDINPRTNLKGYQSLLTLFRGKSDQYPMALPVTITSTDNARDWDYYNGCTYNDNDGTWYWGSIHFGSDAKNTRIFRTSVPVYGTELDIRTLDKSIKNN